MEEPGLGDYVNDWNVPVDSNWSSIDNAFGAELDLTSTGGNLVLTASQTSFQRIVLTGSLTAGLNVVFPSTYGGRCYIFNNCTLNGFSVRIYNGVGDARGGVVVPNQILCPIVFTQNAAFYDDYQSVPPGVIHCYAGASAPPGFLLCNGAAYTTTVYPLLFSAIGYTYGGASTTFNVPDSRGRVLAGADNMGGTAANILTGYVVATSGGEQTHVLVTAELASHNHGVTDPGHNHAITDPGHTHTINAFSSGSGGAAAVVGTTFNATGSTPATNSATTGVTINTHTTGVTTNNNGSGTAHNNIQPTLAVNHIIRF